MFSFKLSPKPLRHRLLAQYRRAFDGPQALQGLIKPVSPQINYPLAVAHL